MKAPATRTGRGALAGILAATTLVLWFLVIDLMAGHFGRTPEFLGHQMLGIDSEHFGALGIGVYTIVHYAAFILVGIVVAWIADKLEVVPGALLGIVLGFALFELMFYGSLIVTGVNVVRELGWPMVLVGNILAGLVMFAALAAMDHVEFLGWQHFLEEHRTIREGLITGAIGAVVVALWFMLIDFIAGRPFFTPAALGSALFMGANSMDTVQVTAPVVLGYTLLHVAAFIITGLVAAAIVAAAEETTEVVLLGAVLLFFVFEVFSIGMIAMLWGWLVKTLSWWSIAVANILAALAMGSYLALRHKRLVYDLTHHDLEEEFAHENS
ncbi:MAG TPA: hypothetical protein VGD49_02340 [Longimicrobiales bacterium]